MDTLFQVHRRGLSLDQTELGTQPPVDGVVLSVFLAEPGLRPPARDTAVSPDELSALLTEAHRVQEQLPVPSWLSFEGHLQHLDLLLAAGVRIFGLVHSWDNPLAGAATDPRPVTTGLTDAGAAAVRAVYAAGALVDVSHMSDEAFEHTAAIAEELGRPLIATHSATRALTPSPRNLTDDQIRRIARSGGLIGVTLHSPHLVQPPHRGRATAADWAAHVEHIVALVGPAHVALGSDLDAMARLPEGITTATDLSKLEGALAGLDLSDGAIESILRGNARRVLNALPSKQDP